MSTALHAALAGANVHVIHAYTYADAAARLAASGFVSADEGRCAYQQNDRTLWVLTRASPVEWKEITAGGGGVTAHATSHSSGGSDPVSVLNLAAGSNDTTKFYRPNGSGGVELATPAGGGGSFDPRDVIVFDHFLLGGFSSGSFGIADWRVKTGGTGASVSQSPEAGHPGVARLEGGTAGVGRASIYLGDTSAGGSLVIGGNAITFEVLVKFAGVLLATELEMFQMGLGMEWTATGELLNGLYVRVVGGLAPTFELVAATGGTRSAVAGTTPVVGGVWYRVGFVWTPGGAGAQLRVNGVDEGAAVTSNIPTAAVGVGVGVDSAGGSIEPVLLLDYLSLTQVTAKED